jgi:glutamyl-tRNA synthetase
MSSGTIRVRFPPSPTGYCHVGTARMALLNYLFAKKHGGTIVFRIEDTDRERSKKEYEEDIVESIKWLGLSWDEFHRQSERTTIYTEHLRSLIGADKAYISEEESKKEAGKRVKVVRLRNPGKTITFADALRGDITFDTTELGDFAIARAEDDPLYHFTVVVDDALMGITHVIRGEDHISNTPRQILIQEALGFARPAYAHYPLFLGSDRSKLSKRQGDVAVRDYRAKGYLPEALVNYIGVLGWTPPSGREIMSLDDMVAEFELDGLHKSGAVFDIEKLNWFNRQYLLALSEKRFTEEALAILREELAKRDLSGGEVSSSLMSVVRERVSVWEDLRVSIQAGEYDYFFKDPAPDAKRIPDKKSLPEEARTHLEATRKTLSSLSDADFGNMETVKASVWEYATAQGRGKVLWPLRYALTGAERSPDPFMVAHVIGKEATLRRIDTAVHLLGAL